MKKVFLVAVSVVMVSSLILSGCAKPALEPITVMTHVEESDTGLVEAWGEGMGQDTGINVKALKGHHPEDRMRMLRGLDYVNVIVNSSGGVLQLMEGVDVYSTRDAGPYQIRLFWPCNTSPFGVAVRKDSGIRSFADIKPGMKISTQNAAAPRQGALAGIAWTGYTTEEIEIVYPLPGQRGAFPPLLEGKADMTWFTPKHPHAMQLSDEDPGLVWLEMDPAKDPEAAARLDKIKPFTQYGRTPVAGNIAKAAHGVSLTINAQYYLVKEELDSELVYLMAKWLGENYDTYKDKSDLATAMDINLFRNLLDNTFIPVHEGVIKYLKEVGMWSAADDERQATNVALFQAYEDAWKAALATADEEMVMVDPEQERWLNIWEEYKSTIPNRIKIEFIAAPSGGPPPGGPPPGGKKPGGPPPGGKKPGGPPPEGKKPGGPPPEGKKPGGPPPEGKKPGGPPPGGKKP